MTAPRPRLVGLGGGSASGKTWLGRALEQALAPHCVVLAHDRYYRSVERGAPLPNFDHPDALETEVLVDHLTQLVRGQPVRVPSYDFTRHRRRPEDEWHELAPQSTIIVEGILVLAVDRLRAELDLAVFVETPADVRLSRRLRRDVVERGRTMLDVLTQYEQTVRPMHDAFIQPSRVHADLVVDGTRPLDELVAQVVPAINGSPG